MNVTANPRRITFNVVINGLLGLFMCTHWIFFPMPERSRLTEHHGALERFGVESSNASTRPNAKEYVFFEVAGESLRFWTEAVKPEDAADVFARPGATVRFYIDDHDNHVFMNGGRKSFGLVVDGRVIQEVDEAVGEDRTIGLGLLPLMGLGFLGYAFYRWQNPTAEEE